MIRLAKIVELNSKTQNPKFKELYDSYYRSNFDILDEQSDIYLKVNKVFNKLKSVA